MHTSALNTQQFSYEKWLLMLQRLAVDMNDVATQQHVEKTFSELQAAHAKAQRYYHTAEHVNACLAWVDKLAEQLKQPDWLRLAFYFHDAVYDPKAADNNIKKAEIKSSEAKSAIWANAFVGKLRFWQGYDNQEAMAEWVNHAILATAGHDVAGALVQDNDLHVFLDIDLSILGAAHQVYQKYSQQIRKEYAHVPDELYRQGRLKVLRHFLAKSHLDEQRIYISEYFFHRLEAQARENIAKEIACLLRACPQSER